MKILLSGYSGFFSKRFIKYISNNNKIDLFCISRKKRKIKKIKFWNLDLSKKNIRKIPQKRVFDLVIHSSIVRIKKNKNNDILQKNINITKNFISILKKNAFKKVINLSSASIYPNINGKFSETSKVNFFQNNDRLYGFSKYLSEIIFDLCIKNKKVIHLRIGNVFGNDKDESIISKMKTKLKQKNFIEIYGNGKRIINLIHITNLIKYIFLIAKKRAYGVFNVSDYSTDINKIAKFIKIKYGNNYSKIRYINLHKKNPKFYLITKKFFNLLNIKKPNNRDLFNEI